MITLDSTIRIPVTVSFTLLEQDAVLLNTRGNKYYALDEVGAELWRRLSDGLKLRTAYEELLAEYDVDAGTLEADLLELLQALLDNGLIEVIGMESGA